MTELGPHMATEMREGAEVFARAVAQPLPSLNRPNAIYTFARGSSDAVANILSYAFMDRLRVPMTSLPPSVFSVGHGLTIDDALGLVISQSGASADLVSCAKGIPNAVAITNVVGSPVEQAVEFTIPVGAGPELAVPATKTVIGSIGAGMALLAGVLPQYRSECLAAADHFGSGIAALETTDALASALAASEHIYVLGRRCSFGVAHEIALKLKETCALHAEAYSASEVLHGPLQLSAKPLTVLVLDAGDRESQDSLNAAEARFLQEGATVMRLSPADVGISGLTDAAAAALLLYVLYPVIHATANRLGLDPDAPPTLKKVTSTR